MMDHVLFLLICVVYTNYKVINLDSDTCVRVIRYLNYCMEIQSYFY